jgi:hypothetical protein
MYKIFKDSQCHDHIVKLGHLPFGLFWLVKNEINRIDNIQILEKTLFSHDLKLADRVDCVAEFDNQLFVIDFKC